MSKYDSVEKHYDDIKMDYLFGILKDDGSNEFLSIPKLAKRYNVSESTLKKVSAREKWKNQQANVRTKIDEKVLDKKSDYEAEKIVQIDEAYETAFSKLRKLTVNAIANKKADKVHSYELVNYANTLITCYEGEKVAHGESLENNNDNEGWNALAEAFKKPPDNQEEKD